MFRSVPSAYLTPSGSVYKPFLALADCPHLLIAGATGSGKSVALNGIIYTLLIKNAPSMCQFVLVDPKRVELIQYARLPHTVKYACEQPDIVRTLQWTVEETDRRFSCMQAAGVREYTGAHLYVVIDELADLMVSMKNETLPLLQRLAQVGRAARVHVIACSQNIMAQTIPTVLRCNFSAVLGLRTATKQQSRFLISAGGCELLPDPKKEGTGYGYFRDGADLVKIRIHKHTDEEMNNVIRWWTSSACIAC